jgi:hypothetical protein
MIEDVLPKPSGYQSSRSFHDRDIYPPEAIHVLESYPSFAENVYAYYRELEYPPPLTSNLHYPYGSAANATSLAIADDGLAAASKMLDCNDGTKRGTSSHDLTSVAEGQLIRIDVSTPLAFHSAQSTYNFTAFS